MTILSEKSVWTNLSLTLNLLLFKNISENTKHLPMPRIYLKLCKVLGSVRRNGYVFENIIGTGKKIERETEVHSIAT